MPSLYDFDDFCILFNNFSIEFQTTVSAELSFVNVFASAFVGLTMIGKTPTQAAQIAGEFTKRAIEKTVGDEDHKYGVKFEQVILELSELLE